MNEMKNAIVETVRSNLTPKKLQENILSYHENDIALALDSLSKEERSKLYKVLDPEALANILEYSEHIVDYIRELNISKRVSVFTHMETAAAVEVLQQFEKTERDSLIELMNPEVRSEIKLLSSFDEDEIGSKMSTNYIAIPEHASVKEAMSDV